MFRRMKQTLHPLVQMQHFASIAYHALVRASKLSIRDDFTSPSGLAGFRRLDQYPPHEMAKDRTG